ESIEVQEQHSKHLLIASRREERLAQAVAEKAAVGKTGERVVQRLVLERIRLSLAFRDVAQCGDEEVARADLHRSDDKLQRQQPPVLALAYGLVGAADGDVDIEAALQVVVERGAMGRRDQDV